MKFCPIQATAYHEAGHAVVAWRLTSQAGGVVTIVPTVESVGHTDHCNPLWGVKLSSDSSANAHRKAEQTIIICLAGPISQRKFSPHSLREWQMAGDCDQAVVIASKLTRSARSAEAFLNWLAIRTRDIVDSHWPAIERVAQALLARQSLTHTELLSEISPGVPP